MVRAFAYDGVPAASNESSDDVMNFAKSFFKEAKVSVPDKALDSAHRIMPIHTDS